MLTTMDAAGRLVVPKAVRDQLGLEAGTPLEITVRDGAIVLAPVPAAMRLVKRGKGLVAEPIEPLSPLTAEQVRATLEGVRR